jgi:ferredoxin-NADP reductase
MTVAQSKLASVVAARSVGRDARLLELEVAEPLGFIGGQYLIVDTGLVLTSGKAVKRAYSILSGDQEQTRFQLAVKRIPDGPGSGFMHAVEPGAHIRFSGPWGKLHPALDADGPVLVVATDTGITAALGLVGGLGFRRLRPRATLLWLRPRNEDIIPQGLAGAFQTGELPPIGHPERIPHVRALVRDLVAAVRPATAFLAGDGAVNYAVLDDLVAAGVPATRDHVESFFNLPRRSA